MTERSRAGYGRDGGRGTRGMIQARKSMFVSIQQICYDISARREATTNCTSFNTRRVKGVYDGHL